MSNIAAIRADLKKDDERFMTVANSEGQYLDKNKKDAYSGSGFWVLIQRYESSEAMEQGANLLQTQIDELSREYGNVCSLYIQKAWLTIRDVEGKDLIFPTISNQRDSVYVAAIWD